MEKIATCDAGCACAGCTPWHKKCILWRRLANSRLHPLQVAPTWWIGAKFDVYILSTFQWRCGIDVGLSGDTALDVPCYVMAHVGLFAQFKSCRLHCPCLEYSATDQRTGCALQGFQVLQVALSWN